MTSRSENNVAQKGPKGNLKRTLPTQPYDPALLNKPYMARIRWSDTGAQEAEWYFWIGKEGEAGRFEAFFNAGDIIMMGQKAKGEYQQSKPRYYLVLAGGKLEPLAHRVNAQQIYWSNLRTEESSVPEDEVRPLAGLSDQELKARYDETVAEIKLRRAEGDRA